MGTGTTGSRPRRRSTGRVVALGGLALLTLTACSSDELPTFAMPERDATNHASTILSYAHGISTALDVRGIDRRAGTQDENVARLHERRITYILKTRANRAGALQQVRPDVDKGRPERLVSFCGDKVKKISPTAFEMVATDFTPQRDLKILLIGPPE